MVNKLDDKACEAFLKDDIDWLNMIKVGLVDTADYTPIKQHGVDNHPCDL